MKAGRARFGGWWLVVTLLCVAASARAAPTELQRAQRHYELLEYDQALAALAGAKREATTPAQRAEVLRLEGFVQIALDRPEEGLAALQKALREDPELHAPPGLSPKLAEVLDRARRLEQARTDARAAVRLQLSPVEPPPVARRSIDVVAMVQGDFAGISGRLMVGEPTHGATTSLPLTRTHEGGSEGRWMARIPAQLVSAGARLTLRAELLHEGDVVAAAPALASAPLEMAIPPYEAALQIESPMSGATMRIDGAVVGHIPFSQIVPVRPGAHRVELQTTQGSVGQPVVVGEGTIERIVLKVQPGSALPVVRGLLVGLGAALVVTGGVLFDQARRATDQYNGLVTRDPITSLPTTDFSRAAPALHSAHAFEAAAIACVSVGGVAAAVGVGLFALRSGRKGRVDARAEGLVVHF